MTETSKSASTKKIKKIGKPNPFIYYPLCIIAGLYLRLRLHIHCDRTAIKKIRKGQPALVVCPHISNMDFILVALTLLPHRPTFVVSEHFTVRPKIGWFLKQMAVIPKKMYCADIRTILSIMRAKEDGQIIVLFPEGRLTCFGHSLNVTEGTAQLVKKLAIDVYTVTGNGAYKTLPKWGKSGFRPGRIQVTTSKLFDAADLKDMSIDQINEMLEAAILHDEEAVLPGIPYRCKTPALGLDGILYRCPCCSAEFQMEICTADTIRCTACGAAARLTADYRLTHQGESPLGQIPFDTINQWYFWQQDEIDLDEPLESDVTVGAVGPDGHINPQAGYGHLTMNRSEIHFSGQVFGQPLEFTESTETIKAFPATVSSHLNLYHQKVLYHMHLTPDPRAVIKWVCY
ncbi:MAG: 1-acyl-sn-glycerol-3-phosphate acyltransferase, partial [Firmicutes bacterium]|nr:1-acyl-sn-glycerol-3-phosphate acyltransferase [Bacillota bacterium]